jgi:phi13 family phage major tail protein
MTKAKESQFKVGVENLFVAFMTTPDAIGTAPVYDEENIYELPVIETLGIAGNPTSAVKWASNKKLVSVSKNNQYTLTLDHPGLPIEVLDKMLGNTGTRGITFDDAKMKEMPYFAIGFIAPLSDNTYQARWYPRCQVTLPEESYTTNNDETTLATEQLVMTASPLLLNDITKADFNSARDSASGITVEDFMKQVVYDESQIATLFPTP